MFAQSLTILFIFLKQTILLVVAKRRDAKARDYGESKKKTDFNIYSLKGGLKFASFLCLKGKSELGKCHILNIRYLN